MYLNFSNTCKKCLTLAYEYSLIRRKSEDVFRCKYSDTSFKNIPKNNLIHRVSLDVLYSPRTVHIYIIYINICTDRCAQNICIRKFFRAFNANRRRRRIKINTFVRQRHSIIGFTRLVNNFMNVVLLKPAWMKRTWWKWIRRPACLPL